MLADLRLALAQARSERYAVGAFNVFDYETAAGVTEGLVQRGAAGALAVGAHRLKNIELSVAAAMLHSLVEMAPVPLSLHLDHARDLDTIQRALEAGFNSAMYDGAGLPFDEKLATTRRFVDMAHSYGAVAEAELEHIGRSGVEDGQGLTDPLRARQFAEETGIDVLAVAVGSVHGLSRGQARIDVDLVASLSETTPCYLSLHGSSGVPLDDIGRAVDAGISKVAYFTGMAAQAMERLKRALDDGARPAALPDVLGLVKDAFRDETMGMLDVLGRGRRGAAGQVE